MGVTYKLKKEIVDYILQQKKINSQFSCRKIADLASQFFQKNISKSSVSNILKTFLLSSPVGRRSKKQKKQEKFKIPEERKKELFVHVPTSVLIQESVIKEPPQECPVKASHPEKEEYNQIPHLGSVLLKIAEQELSDSFFFSEILKEDKEFENVENIDQIASALLFAPIFGVQNEQEIFANSNVGLWKIHGFDQKPEEKVLKQAVIKLKNLEKKQEQISLEYVQVFSEAAFFNFYLENGTEFAIDVRMNSVWTKDNVHSGFSLSLSRSLDFLSRKIISNLSPIILRTLPFGEVLPNCFYDMACAFEGSGSRKITRVDLVNAQKEILSSFDFIINKKRLFIVHLPSTQSLFTQRKQQDYEKNECTIDFLNKQCLFYETSLEGKDPLTQSSVFFRAIIFNFKDEDMAPFVLITNITKEQKDSQLIISEYLHQWPYCQQGIIDFMNSKIEPTFGADQKGFVLDEREVEEVLGKAFNSNFLNSLTKPFLANLHNYCKKHFFSDYYKGLSFVDTKNRVYDLFGAFDKKDDIIDIKLISPQDRDFKKNTESILRKINESAVKSSQKNIRFFCKLL